MSEISPKINNVILAKLITISERRKHTQRELQGKQKEVKKTKARRHKKEKY